MTRRSRRSGASRHCVGSPEFAKAQHCHAHSGEVASRHIRALLQQQGVTARIIELFHATYGSDALSAAWDKFRCGGTEIHKGASIEFTAESPFLGLFASWLAHTWTPAMLPEIGLTVPDHVPTRTFLDQNPDLDRAVARYLNACIETPFSFYEVLACAAGRGFSCCDLICGGWHAVPQSLASMLLRPHDIIFGRFVELDSVSIIDAAAPFVVPECLKPALLTLREEILEGTTVAARAEVRRCLLAHEFALRSCYWSFIESALKDGSLWLQVTHAGSIHNAAENLLMALASSRTVAEVTAENDRLLQDSEVRQKFVEKIREHYENWVSERLALFGNRTALEAVATPEGQSQVAAVLAEIEGALSLLPVSLDPQIYRRMRERLGLQPAKGLH